MTNKTIIPAFQASVGDWKYYLCVMKYAEVANQINFAYELGGNSDLGKMIQRGITDRTKEIQEYLLTNEHRFLGALVVAVYGGKPNYTPYSLDFDEDSPLSGTDRSFGILELHGTQMYFALDGQHRLRAIKDSIKLKPELGSEDIPVILVAHYDTPEGQERTRRLFTNINRNAKTTSTSENIALDEDDGFAILTRKLVTIHPFLSKADVVKIYTKQGNDGELKLAGKSVPQTDASAWTTLHQLYEIAKRIGFDLPLAFNDPAKRPTDQDLEDGYEMLVCRLDSLLKACGNTKERVQGANHARDVRAPKGDVGRGHPFMRPVIQESVCEVLRTLCQSERLSWDEALNRLTALPWRIENAPWLSVFNPENSRMITAKENKDLLRLMLEVHLAPPSKQAIAKARREFKTVRQFTYPMSQSELEKQLLPED